MSEGIQKKMSVIGMQWLSELIDCDAKILDDIQGIKRELEKALIEAGDEVINSVLHQFNPYGVSGVTMAKESHLAIHTWPEYRYAAIDLFTSNMSLNTEALFESIKKSFQCHYFKIKEIPRGPEQKQDETL